MVMQPDELRALRKQAGMTQAQLADALGISRKTMNEAETGARPIDRRTELAARFIATLMGSNTMFAMAARCEKAARGEDRLDADDLMQIAAWLRQATTLPHE